jgi:tRNA-specific 2-thiouridylase
LNIVDELLFTTAYNITCRIRYRKQNTACRVILLPDNKARVELAEPLESIAPGQSAVFYQHGRILGGGFIE